MDAISLDPLTVRGESCDGCDRCVVACHTAALQPNAKRRQAHLAALTRVRRGSEVTFACRMSAPPRGSISANCVATMDPLSIVVCLLVGATRVELCHGTCAACPHGEGAIDSLAAIIDAANRVGRALSLGGCTARGAPLSDKDLSESVDPRGARQLTRRGLLRGWLRSGQDTAVRVMSDKAEDELADIRLRDLAATLLAGRRLPSTPLSGAELGGRPRAADTCTRCGACVAICPTEALSQGKHDDSTSAPPLALFAARCTGCELCVSACPEGAMSVDSAVDLAEWAPRPIKIIDELTVVCVHCGGVALAPFLPVCASCHRETRGRVSTGS